MEQPNRFIKELCNELAQPLTTLGLALELLERGVALPQDLQLMRSEIERLNSIVEELRGSTFPRPAILAA